MVSEKDGFLSKEKTRKQKSNFEGHKKKENKHVRMHPYEKPKNRNVLDAYDLEDYDDDEFDD